MSPLLEITHTIEKRIGRRLTNEEYKEVKMFLFNKSREQSIANGLFELYDWANSLPSDVKDAVLKGCGKRGQNC